MSELRAMLEAIGLTEASVAVRSSATGEDGEKHAFAGIHESYLNVNSVEGMVRAVLKCFASLWIPQAVAYRRRFGLADKDVRGAVLVCEMVTADNGNEPIAAGVVFTADPCDGRRDILVVETTQGMGDKLVSGEVTPTTTRVKIKVDGFEYIGAYDAAINGLMPQAKMDELVMQAWRLHWAFSDGEQPQDIEWAYDGARIVMLQVRPVTSLPRCTYDDWLQKHGHRGYNEFDIANPRWLEDRAGMVRFVQKMGMALHSPKSAHKVRENAESELGKLPFIMRKIFGWLMGKARNGFALRERGKSTMISVLGVSRHIILALGRKMYKQGLISQVDDVFYLSFADVQAWAENVWDGQGAVQLVKDRQQQMLAWQNGQPPADVILVDANVIEPMKPVSAVDGNLISGMGVSPGIVVEIGGYLSHGAIVAREFGLPAVVNAAGAFDAINVGDELIVDGNVGKVEIRG